MNKIFLKKSFALDKEEDGTIKGDISGIAYSGSIIADHFPFENLIIDVSTLTVAKIKTPIFRDHFDDKVAGHGLVTIEGNTVLIDGKISKRSQYGKEIIDLSEDGFEWQMSMGIYGGEYEEIEDTEVNGIMVDRGVALRNGTIREVSVCALGADGNTSAEIFSKKEKKDVFMLTKEQWVKLACGCGGDKNTTPDELESKFAASQEEIDEKQAEVDELKKKLAEAEAALEKIKEEEESEAREEQLKAAVESKGLELSVEKIKSAAKSKDSTAMLLSFIGDMKKVETSNKIDKSFAEKLNLGDASSMRGKDDAEAIRLKANAMVKSGEASNFLDAINKLKGT